MSLYQVPKKKKQTKKIQWRLSEKILTFRPFFQVFNFLKYKSCYKSLQNSHSSETEIEPIFFNEQECHYVR